MEEGKILTGILTEERLKPFLPFLKDDDITDVDWNGDALWVNTIHNESMKIPNDQHTVTKEYINAFVQNVANSISQHFNKEHYKLEADTDEYNLRVTLLHESVAKIGHVVCLRKTTIKPRLSYDTLLQNNYCSKEVLNLLINCVIGKCNIIICGEPEAGKTEFGKYLSLYIPDDQKTITIEDTLEWHYHELKPNASHILLQVNKNFTYTEALKECMRINPKRIILSEVRSVEAMNLIEVWNAGSKGITTLHTDDVRKIPDRILNMMPTRMDAERLHNNVYENLDVGVLIRRRKDKDDVFHRYIDQIYFFDRVNEENMCYAFVKDGKIVSKELPESKVTKLNREYIYNPFELSVELKEKYERKENKEKNKSNNGD